MSARCVGRRLLLTAALAAAATAAPRGDNAPTRRDADNLVRKLVEITDYSAAPRAKAGRAGRATTITEPEVNAYLRYHAASEIPAGVTEPYITIVGDGRLEGRATVDLDAVRLQKRRSWTDPLGYVGGRLPVHATGVLQARDGIGRFTLDSASIGGVPVPKMVLQEVVSYYTRSQEDPSGVSLDDPFELPARIREIKVAAGRAVVVQ